ncbi:ATP-grasp domain-containing protein [Agromyces sp. NPDC058484]|uniref:ATP-grasp domain-containing protein n=1 Tax=Agromyces sp. NPDC058484 TaxID=3346524 RepID=UPI00364EE6E1
MTGAASGPVGNRVSDRVTAARVNVLITSAGQRVSLVRAFKKEVSAFDDRNRVYTVDLNPALAPACHVSDGFSAVPSVTDPGYPSDLLALCLAWRIGIVVPTIDTELAVLAKSRSRFEEHGIHIVVSASDFIEKCRDKRIIADFFSEHDIDVPKTIDRANPDFPLFVKPFDGSRSEGARHVRDASELHDHDLENPKLMFMEYIDHAQYEEFTVDAYYGRDGRLKCAVPRKRIHVRAGEINKGVTRKNEIVGHLRERLHLIPGAAGCLTMQFFFHPTTKRVVGIEVNPRFGGGYPLSYLAGANFPRWIVDEYVNGQDIPYFEAWEDGLLMLRYDDEVVVRGYEE